MMRIAAFVLTVVVVLVPGASAVALAQTGAVGATPPPAQAMPLPLSGRSPQGGSVTAIQSPVPGTTTSVNTINPSVQVQGPYGGSSPSTPSPFPGKLTLPDAIERGLGFNLGPAGLNEALRQARGQSRSSRSALLPNITGFVTEAVQQTNLRATGLRIEVPVPGFTFPTVVGPFNYTDFRARLTQTILDLTAVNNYRATEQMVRANEYSLEDARDLTVFAVAGAYLEVSAAAARIDAAQAQLQTVNELFNQTSQQRNAGLVAQIDVNRTQVQVLTQQQRIVSLQNDLAKRKINLARLTGVPVNDQYSLASEITYSQPPTLTVEQAVSQALEQRADLKAAEAQVQAAERARAAARSERLPSLGVSADYGAIGENPARLNATFSVVGSLRVPLYQGGRTGGNVEQAEAALAQRRIELADARGRIESEVRNAFLDMQAAASQIDVAQRNLEVTRQTLGLTRQRFDAGVSDNLAVVQSQDAIASAQLDYINSVFAHNLAKLALARAMGVAAEDWQRFLTVR